MVFLRGLALFALAYTLSTGTIQAQTQSERKGEFYFSWGYNTEWYTRSNVYVNQPELQNNYSFRNIKGHDRKGWDDEILNKDFTIPQYNYRIGYFFNKKKGLGFEINFDHTKFIFSDGQNAAIKGTLNGRAVDSSVVFSQANGFYYYLNNGANFLLFNIVKRMNVYTTKKNQAFKIDFLGKAGIGPVIPHVENSFFGHANDPHFQFGGWNVGLEAAFRFTFAKYIYLEYCNKLDYARYSNLKIYSGTAKHAFGTYEMILNLGGTFPMGKKIH
ncbi:MAG: hypothetical protein C5B52_05455 [Bacteroidetes bacterium]|nr:MAG: hypothetical protein C5B52_05455 [Bacteroidota bacterium]